MAVDSSRYVRQSRAKRLWAWLRWAPFVIIAALSVWAAGRAPQGRRPPEFDWDLSAEMIMRALSKRPHIVYMLLLFLLAVMAIGVARRWWAAAMTLGIGLLWELVQLTVIGHNPRLADLLPDIVGIGIGIVTISIVETVRSRLHRPMSRSPNF